eukprot:Rmarinus@m.23801
MPAWTTLFALAIVFLSAVHVEGKKDRPFTFDNTLPGNWSVNANVVGFEDLPDGVYHTALKLASSLGSVRGSVRGRRIVDDWTVDGEDDFNFWVESLFVSGNEAAVFLVKDEQRGAEVGKFGVVCHVRAEQTVCTGRPITEQEVAAMAEIAETTAGEKEDVTSSLILPYLRCAIHKNMLTDAPDYFDLPPMVKRKPCMFDYVWLGDSLCPECGPGECEEDLSAGDVSRLDPTCAQWTLRTSKDTEALPTFEMNFNGKASFTFHYFSSAADQLVSVYGAKVYRRDPPQPFFERHKSSIILVAVFILSKWLRRKYGVDTPKESLRDQIRRRRREAEVRSAPAQEKAD